MTAKVVSEEKPFRLDMTDRRFRGTHPEKALVSSV